MNRLDAPPDLLPDLLARLAVDDAVELFARVPADLRRRALAGRLPEWGELREAIVRWVVAYGDAGSQLAALGDVPRYRNSRRDFVRALADAADPDVRTAVYLHPEADPVLRRRMLTVGPYAGSVPDGLRKALLATRSRHLLGPARDAADPAIARRAAALVRGPKFQPPPRTPAAVHAWLAVPVPERTEAEQKRGVPHRLGPSARRVRARLATLALEQWTAADWAALAALHRERPLDPMTTSRLAGHAACPTDAALDLLRHTAREGFHEVATHAILAGTLTWDDLLTRAVPAASVIAVMSALPLTEDRESAHGTAGTRKRLVEQVRSRLGDEPMRWWSLLVLLRGAFPGTVPELLDAAAASAPEPGTVEFASTNGLAGSPWTYLLSLAAPEKATEIVPGVAELTAPPGARAKSPGTLAGEMLSTWALQNMPSGVVEGFIAVADARQRVALAQRLNGYGPLMERLLELDEPAVNASLVTRPHLPARLRRRILSGTSHATGRPGSLALHASVTVVNSRQSWFNDTKYQVLTRNATTIAEVLRSHRPLHAPYQVAGCRRLVELGRLDLVASFVGRTDPALGVLPLPALADALRGPLAAADRDAALAALRALTKRLFRNYLTAPDLQELTRHLEVEDTPDWAVVAAEMRARPLSADVLAVLAQHGEDMPEDLARLLLTTAPERCAPYLAHRTAELARLALDIAPVAHRRTGPSDEFAWLGPCLEKGLLTAEDWVARGRPVRHVLRSFRHDQRLRARVDAAIRDLTVRHGPLSLDTLLVVAVLADDFPGTLAELLATATAATVPT
ncbi:hypothetical protein [Streptodolium elevatio]|uniref:Secreted protein n=1 Tax=Streptodolium elevatio TaxID=3157996 RepID=A0ABV3D9T6_9ACTN